MLTVHSLIYRATEEVNEEIVEQQSLADIIEDETTASDMPSPHEEENDQKILTSIVTDGRYDMTPEDRSILESIATPSYFASQ